VRAVWNRGQHATLQGLAAIEAAQPFTLKGVDSDNGGEFLNHHLHGWLKGRGIKQTRSRPYRKNDQARVEQKNWTHVRQLLGYDRLGYEELVEPLNGLLSLWSLWKNLYHVSMEQTEKRREGSRQIRRHAKRSRTPAQRLESSGQLSEEQKERITAWRRTSDPFAMRTEIERRLAGIWELRARLEAAQHGEDDLAGEGSPALRSVNPSPARKTTNNQDVMVSAM